MKQTKSLALLIFIFLYQAIQAMQQQEPPHAKELTTWKQTSLHEIFEQPATHSFFWQTPNDIRQLIKTLVAKDLNQKRDQFIQSYKDKPQEGVEYAAEHNVYDFPTCREAFKQLGAFISLVTCVQQNRPSAVACLLQHGDIPSLIGDFRELKITEDGKEEIIIAQRTVLEHALLHRYREIAALLIDYIKGEARGRETINYGNCYNGHDEPLSGPKLSKETVNQFNGSTVFANSVFELACQQKCESKQLVAKTPQLLGEDDGRTYYYSNGIPRLYIAAVYGDVRAVQACIDAGDSVDAWPKFFHGDPHYTTTYVERKIAVNEAAKRGHIAVVDLLIKHNAMARELIKDAASTNQLEMVLFLLRRQIQRQEPLEKEEKDAIKYFLFYPDQSQEQHIELLKELLKYEVSDEDKKFILCKAVVRHIPDAVDCVLETGVNLATEEIASSPYASPPMPLLWDIATDFDFGNSMIPDEVIQSIKKLVAHGANPHEIYDGKILLTLLSTNIHSLMNAKINGRSQQDNETKLKQILKLIHVLSKV